MPIMALHDSGARFLSMIAPEPYLTSYLAPLEISLLRIFNENLKGNTE